LIIFRVELFYDFCVCSPRLYEEVIVTLYRPCFLWLRFST
jgi:hypothetical protein